MESQPSLQTKLEKLLGSKNVYYQPPENLKMSYPAIRYSKSDMLPRYADNKRYNNYVRYDITVIDRRPDNPVIEGILDGFLYTSYDRHFISDNLHHDMITLYY